jgi:hypothetical protein
VLQDSQIKQENVVHGVIYISDFCIMHFISCVVVVFK